MLLLFVCLWSVSAVPFDVFLKSVRESKHTNYVGVHPESFEEMKQHVLDTYDGAVVTNSYKVGEDLFDCITIDTQPTVRAMGLKKHEILQSHLPLVPDNSKFTDNSVDLPSIPTKQPEGRNRGEEVTGCIEGTIPMKRLTLSRLTRFSTLQHFFTKNPLAVDSTQASHLYAHGSQFVKNFGGSSKINLWDPSITSDQFSLSQQWFVYGNQTVEGGWVKNKYFGPKSTLFIYSTTDSYKIGTGCYNLDCVGFVQTNNIVALGSSFSTYSSINGSQIAITFQWYCSNGNWFFYLPFYSNSSIGYYPAVRWNGGPMSKLASRIDFGGETSTNSNVYPVMGSGQFPRAGFGHAAYQSILYYFPVEGGARGVFLTISTTSKCYNISYHFSQDQNWENYFFFGGPGGLTTDCGKIVR